MHLGAVVLAALVVVSTVACGGEDPPVGAVCDLVVGDVAVSELMPNPRGADSNNEWIELFNRSSASRTLDRAVLRRLGVDENGEPVTRGEVTLGGIGALGSRSYLVLGDGAPNVAPIDASYDDAENSNLLGGSLGALGNEAGGVALLCRGKVIDEVWYGTADGVAAPEEGVSLAFDGGVEPDALLNDQASLWCAGGEAYDVTGNVGSPGEANVACGLTACEAGGQMREIVAPEPGDLVVNELLLDPSGTDGKQFWIEVFVAANRSVDLNGVRIVSSPTGKAPKDALVQSAACVEGAPGTYLVLGASLDPTESGGVAADAVALGLAFGASMFASGGTVELRVGDGVIDTATLPPADGTSGVSLALDAGALQLGLPASRNDQGSAYCWSTSAGPAGFVGFATPGAPNDACGTVACVDGGNARAVVGPGVGELIVSEVLADPAGSDRNKEWIELYVQRGPVDLNGLLFTNTTAASNQKTAQVTDLACRSVATGQYVVVSFQHAADVGGSVDTGGVSPTVVAKVTDDSFLYATAIAVELAWGGVVVDRASVPAAGSGVSQSVKPDALDVVGNDTEANFCAAQTTGVYTGKGTPGAANACSGGIGPVGPTCLVSATPRALVAPAVGSLVVTEVYSNPPSPGSDDNRDWIEVFNAGATSFDLNGLEVDSTSSGGTKRTWTLAAGDCVSVAPGAYAVVAGTCATGGCATRSQAIAGVTPALTFSGSSSDLLYAGASVLAVRSGTTVLDVLPALSGTSGKSKTLDKDALTAVGNDAVAAWCDSTAALNGFTDPNSDGTELGSPGVAANQDCP